MKHISKEALKLLKQIEKELAKRLPSDEELKQPMRAKERSEWADAMLELMFLMDNIIYLECGYTMPHKLRELGAQSGLTSERMRQVEEKSIRKICQNNSMEDLKDFKLAVEEFSAAKIERTADFVSNTTYQTPYKDPNGQTQQQSA